MQRGRGGVQGRGWLRARLRVFASEHSRVFRAESQGVAVSFGAAHCYRPEERYVGRRSHSGIGKGSAKLDLQIRMSRPTKYGEGACSEPPRPADNDGDSDGDGDGDGDGDSHGDNDGDGAGDGDGDGDGAGDD